MKATSCHILLQVLHGSNENAGVFERKRAFRKSHPFPAVSVRSDTQPEASLAPHVVVATCRSLYSSPQTSRGEVRR